MAEARTKATGQDAPVTAWDDEEIGASGSPHGSGAGAGGINDVRDILNMPLDFEGVDENAARELVPNGLFKGVIAECVPDVSQNKNPMLSVRVSVPYNGKNRSLYTVWMLTPEGMGITKRNILAINPEADFSAATPAKLPAMVEGRPCMIRTRIRTKKDTGEPFTEIRQFLPVADAAAASSFLDD